MSIHISLPEWPLKQVRAIAAARGARIWVVGGVVRDALLGRPVHDWDFVVNQDALGLARAVGDALGGAYFPLDKERGAGRVILAAKDDARMELDFAALRGADLEADLVARDLTINAMALDETGALVDPLDGETDLRARRIRATSERAFQDDPLRMLRATRLEAELGFEFDFAIEPQTAAWIRRDALLLALPSAERLRDEFARGMAVPGASAYLQRVDELGLLPRVAPELEPLKTVTQSPPHRFDVWRHTLATVDTVERVIATVTGEPLRSRPHALADVPPAAWGDLARVLSQFSGELREHLAVEFCNGRDRALLLKLAALLHDVGKPETWSEGADGRIHFYGHEPAGARIAAARLQKLRFSRDEARRMHVIVEGHLRPLHLARAKKVTRSGRKEKRSGSRRAVYRYFRATGDAGVEIVLLSLADHLATWGPNLQERRWARRLETAELLLSHYFERREETITPPPLVSGHDLMSTLGLEAGPEIGRLIEALREAQAAGEVRTREEALALAAQISRAATSCRDSATP
jgi:tRNA nucleotidyltransferase/poly(A) polymerase